MDILLLALRLLLAVLLYTFIATVLVMVWRDLHQATIARKEFQPNGRLVILQTESEQLTAGDTFSLSHVTSIGRSLNNTIPIPDTYASGQHALLSWREGQWWLEDQKSRNGTRLNGTCIEDPTIVSIGDIIGIGDTKLKLEE